MSDSTAIRVRWVIAGIFLAMCVAADGEAQGMKDFGNRLEGTNIHRNALEDWNLYQFSANAKAYLTAGGTIRPYVNGGIGSYKFSPGSTNFSGNFGAGLLYVLTPHWGLQGSHNFHAVNTPVAATKFSTLQGGIRLVF
jgi:outer membrane protein with beta-barrel domain